MHGHGKGGSNNESRLAGLKRWRADELSGPLRGPHDPCVTLVLRGLEAGRGEHSCDGGTAALPNGAVAELDGACKQSLDLMREAFEPQREITPELILPLSIGCYRGEDCRGGPTHDAHHCYKEVKILADFFVLRSRSRAGRIYFEYQLATGLRGNSLPD